MERSHSFLPRLFEFTLLMGSLEVEKELRGCMGQEWYTREHKRCCVVEKGAFVCITNEQMGRACR